MTRESLDQVLDPRNMTGMFPVVTVAAPISGDSGSGRDGTG
jgi:hypothetical protein